MKSIFSLLILALAVSATSSQAQTTGAQSGAKIDPALVSFVHGGTQAKTANVFIVLQNLDTNRQFPQRYDHAQVVTFLHNAAVATKQQFDAYLAKVPNVAAQVRPYKFFVSSLTYSAIVTPEGLKTVSQGPGVLKIYANRRITRDPTSRPVEARALRDAYPYDLKDVALDQVRAQFPTLNGTGVVLGSVDTGVDGNHPALRGKIKLFYDGDKHAVGTPHDTDEHGTHTIGTMVGDGQGGAPMGTAPKAQVISAAALSDFNVMLESMDFMLDPDKNPNTPDYPRAINNSWNTGGAPDQELFYRAINAWDAAGILPVFSAGNAGPGNGTITHPHEHPAAFAVAATGEDGKVTNFSSRGPGMFNGKPTQKPDVSAPGNNIVSSIPGGKYASMSGTSMAAPHVTGASALLFQIDPKLTPVQIRELFLKSAVAVDENGQPSTNHGWNKVYGLGKMSVLNAVKLAQSVANRRFGTLEMLPLLASPEIVAVNEILALDQPTSVDPYAFPAELEGQSWVSAAELFR